MKNIGRKKTLKPEKTSKKTKKIPFRKNNEDILRALDKISKKEKKRGVVFFLIIFFKILGGVFFLAILSVIGWLGYSYWKTPPMDKLISDSIAQTSIIYDRTGEHILYEIHGEENRKIIPGSEMPEYVKLATVAAEDQEFWNHPGIDAKAILRAVKADIGSSEIQQGASTITQQLARNVFLSREKTWKRKISEILLAIKIERNFSKKEILEMYLNEVPYGSNAYGIESAANIFFDKKARDLELDEAAILAALPNATTFYSPHGSHLNELKSRKNYVLNRMRQLKMISKEEAEKAKEENTLSRVRPFTQPIDSPHFVFYAKEQLEKLYGKEAVEQGGLRVYTTLDWEKQRLAEKIVAEKIVTIGKDYGAENASLCAIDPKTGEVLAMVGSKNYFDRSIDGQVNVTISPRQPGSSFKPFAYAAAFEAGYQPETILYDLPANFGPDGTGEDYKPNNYNGNFSGPVSMRQALAMSLNIPAVKTLYLAGINNTLALAEKMGISTLSDKSRFGLAVVLGGAEVTLLEETSAFSVFANDGKRNPTTPFLKIENSKGEIIFQNQAKNEQVISGEVARKINSILSDNSARAPVFGTNNKLVIPGRQIAAKTGTTQDFHDAWTVGFTPGLAAGVWVGNNDNAAMDTGADGSYVAAPIWNEFMTKALENYPNENFVDYDKSQAEKMRKKTSFPKVVYINKKSGKEISQKKAKKTDSDKVGVKIEYPDNWGTSGEFLFPEMQDTNDPMILRWKASLNDPELLSKLGKNEDEDED